jgi:hypothetical protein
MITFQQLSDFVHQPSNDIIDQLGLPACQAAIQILQHLKAIENIIDSDN